MSIEQILMAATWSIGLVVIAGAILLLAFTGMLTPKSSPDPDPIRQNLLDASER